MGIAAYEIIRQYFYAHAITYREIEHAPGAATEEYHQAVGCRYEQQAKCLFLEVQRKEGVEYVIYAIPASRKADFKALKSLLNAKDVKFGPREVMQARLQCDFGEVAPVGKPFGVPLLFDSELLEQEEIFLNAGLLTRSFALEPAALVALEGPVIIERVAKVG